jgi:hypothetical protein
MQNSQLAAIVAAILTIAATSVSAGASSGPVTVPNTFVAGTPAKAADVNADFAVVADAINQTAQTVSVLQAAVQNIHTGAPGPQGPQGAEGPVGTAGAAGARGAAGPAGPAGPAGSAGPMGPTGAQGASGSAGAVGLQGPAGATGAAGATGPQGPAATSINVYDANSVVIGQYFPAGEVLITSQGNPFYIYVSVSGFGSSGYYLYFSTTDCTGTPYFWIGAGQLIPIATTSALGSSTVYIPEATQISIAINSGLQPGGGTCYPGQYGTPTVSPASTIDLSAFVPPFSVH